VVPFVSVVGSSLGQARRRNEAAHKRLRIGER
jgi:hypothetical protein